MQNCKISRRKDGENISDLGFSDAYLYATRKAQSIKGKRSLAEFIIIK